MTYNYSVSRMAALCRQRNETVMASYAYGGVNLDTFVLLQAKKVIHNRQVRALIEADDYEESVLSLTKELLGDDAAKEMKTSLEKKVICSADHHGSLYCSQFLQGDMLFALLLEKLGEKNPAVPILAAGQVELENSTYSRGICAYSLRDNKQFIPIFPAKYSVQLASHAEPVSQEMVERFKKRLGDAKVTEIQKRTLNEICTDIYENDEIRNAKDFSSQTTLIGQKLIPRLFTDKAPMFTYLEMETVVQPLLLKELEDESSIVYKFLYDRNIREKVVREKFEDGLSLGDLLFRAADEKGRKIMLSLNEDGTLTGRDWRKEPVSFSTKKDDLTALFKEKKVFPGVFTEALILFFERGITWMGGMFQASYLPKWQEMLTRVLEKSELTKEAEVISAYDCTGYICGPMFLLHGGDDFATTTGPVELWGNPISFERVRELSMKTGLWDAHMIGLSEMYFDLVLRDERESEWYRKIAEEVFRIYPGNVVTNERR
ncbi:hypothetical protein [Butyrivibrio sp. AE3004]|uniref:hypothetical protein n=1 Tax=Butyrivibrio sp. AE3004 TaxID=1506994 RepID=UPI000493E78D|nr:hypothetical protein [Butyrivibrio sp. AE3004]